MMMFQVKHIYILIFKYLMKLYHRLKCMFLFSIIFRSVSQCFNIFQQLIFFQLLLALHQA